MHIQELSINSYTQNDFQMVCRKLQQTKTPVLQISLCINPLDSNYAASFRLESQPLEVNYSPQILSQVNSFFVVPKTEDSTKTAA